MESVVAWWVLTKVEQEVNMGKAGADSGRKDGGKEEKTAFI